MLNVALALEYEEVCHRPEQRLATGFTVAEMDAFVNTLIGLALPVESHFRWRPALRDPADEMVLETAVNGHADAIVTFNGRDFIPVPAQFGIEILLPREVLRRMTQ